ncbi:tRNA (adenosine(37)-N6)-dimethylallyltransferase MiaA [Thioclava sp. SK-1]|nr:tRNA (adenosine(37)-N6)-dimethylallyltransferase MiaA [Thioclava sp. SK-1]
MAIDLKFNSARPIVIGGATASGKSALALQIARDHGGVVVNADALQVWSCWRVLSARPSAEESAQAPHLLYGHITPGADYSVGHWLREVSQIVEEWRAGDGARPIIVGGTGLYLSALTQGLAQIPPTPAAIRDAGDKLRHEDGHNAMFAQLDAPTAARVDRANPMRVQRAWEVLQATGRGLAAWQDDTPPPLLPLTECDALVIEAQRDWLAQRIDHRFDLMLEGGALEEVRAVQPMWDSSALWAKAIGAPELIDYLQGSCDLAQARSRAQAASRQYAKRQRTWFRSRMSTWHKIMRPDQE